MRHRGGHSTITSEIVKFLLSQAMASSHNSKWHIGNNIGQCTLCGRCEVICPVNAITVSRHNKTWTLNNARCSQCLNCIVKCPTHCLTQVNFR